ncbi:hypothetical protein ACJJTC_010742 [Scirpophaga incertulas]
MGQCYKRRPNVAETYSEDTKQYVRTYIKNLPAIPSHYNRKRSNKKYLPQEFKNVSNLYRLYSEHCKSMQNKDSSDDKYQRKVLNTPYGESMLLYYSRKYAVYNLTFYESVTQNVFCVTWGETDAQRGSNEIATCLTKYLENVDSRGIKNVILYCDSCSGHNKNKNVLAAINYFLRFSKHIEVVQVNYLLPGHTYMPVDSVHSIMEREVKRLIVWSPSQWSTFFESARKQPRPYTVIVLDHSDSLNYDDYAAELFTKDTLKNIMTKNLRIETLKKKNTNKIVMKYSMKEHAECYEVKLELPSNSSVKDRLAETDEEEDNEDNV